MYKIFITLFISIQSVFAALDIEHVSDAVVNVAAKFKPPLTDLVKSPSDQTGIAHGSGVIIDQEEGLIITNAHVIKDPELIIVTLNNGQRLHAKKIGVDKESDLALIQIQSDHLEALKLAQTSPNIGEKVYAIGNPFGLDHTITSGIISGLHRQVGQLYNLIQTDAPINPGNSGGALVNESGELIGICTAITTVSGGSIGLGFVIPIDVANAIIQQLRTHGDVKRGVFGVIAQPITPALKQAYKLSPKSKGVLVAEVLNTSAAEKAHIVAGDIITAINGVSIDNPNELKAKISSLRVDDTISITYIHALETIEKKVVLTEFKPSHANYALSGAALKPFEQLNGENHVVSGLQVVNVQDGSQAFLAGFEANDILTAIDQKPIDSLSHFIAMLKHTDQPHIISVMRDNTNLFIAITPQRKPSA